MADTLKATLIASAQSSLWGDMRGAFGAVVKPISQAREAGMSRIPTANQAVAVIKIGGSILTNARAYRRAAIFVRNRHRASLEEKLVVVVSAQQGVTDALERTARRIVGGPDAAALDLLWSTGELRSVALLALNLQRLGVSAAALNIHEAGLGVDADTRRRGGGRGAERVRLNSLWIRNALARHAVAVVPGFLGTDPTNAVVSLGRGGSDLTAVLLAQGLRACRCELLKDVSGYFTSDPHRDPAARHLPRLTFDEALALADDGCDLVQRKAIETAARCGLPLVVRCLDDTAPTSLITTAPIEVMPAEAIPSAAAAP
jgi:aspartate kinase